MFLENKEEISDKLIQNREIISDSTWLYSYNKSKTESEWKKVKVVGYSPKINSFIYRPSLIDGKRSYTEDSFGLKSELYFRAHLIFGKFLAKIIRFFTI